MVLKIPVICALAVPKINVFGWQFHRCFWIGEYFYTTNNFIKAIGGQLKEKRGLL